MGPLPPPMPGESDWLRHAGEVLMGFGILFNLGILVTAMWRYVL